MAIYQYNILKILIIQKNYTLIVAKVPNWLHIAMLDVMEVYAQAEKKFDGDLSLLET